MGIYIMTSAKKIMGGGEGRGSQKCPYEIQANLQININMWLSKT